MRKQWPAISVGLLTWAMAAGGAAEEDIPRGEHPRPDLRRDGWLSLNGPWQFRFDPDDRGLDQK